MLTSNQKIIIEFFQLGNIVAISNIPPVKNEKNSPNFKLPSPNAQDNPIAKSTLGTPLWDRISICPKGSFQYIDPVTNQPVTVPSFNIDTALITISRPTKVIETSIQGRDYSVIEYIGKENWQINIKAGFYGSINQRPKDLIASLVNLEAAKTSFPVWSTIFQEWGIDEIVIKNIRLPQAAGSYAMQIFEINAISDIPFLIAASGTQINTPASPV